MDYTMLANELLNIRSKLLFVPADRQLAQMVSGERFVLSYLAKHENTAHPKELSEKMGVSTARIAALLKSLEKKKLIQRYADPEDNRQVVVKLTEEGKQKNDQAYAEVISNVSELLRTIGPEDAEAFIRIQKKLCEKLLEKN